MNGHRKKDWVEIFFCEQIQNWFANKNKRKKQAIIMKGSNPRTVLGHKQNTSQKCNAVEKPDAAGHRREGLSLGIREQSHRALCGVQGWAARLVTATSAPTAPRAEARPRMMTHRRDVERSRDGFAHGEKHWGFSFIQNVGLCEEYAAGHLARARTGPPKGPLILRREVAVRS